MDASREFKRQRQLTGRGPKASPMTLPVTQLAQRDQVAQQLAADAFVGAVMNVERVIVKPAALAPPARAIEHAQSLVRPTRRGQIGLVFGSGHAAMLDRLIPARAISGA